MIIYNDIKNLTPFTAESDKMLAALKQEDVKLLDEDVLTSQEYYNLSALRKTTLSTHEKVAQYIDACYEQTFSKLNSTIYFSWFVEALCFKYGLVGLNIGMKYIDCYLDLIIEKLDDFNESQLAVCVKQLSWLGSRVGLLFQNLSLMQPGIEPIYNIADYIHMTKPGTSKRLLTQEEEKTLTLDEFKKTFDTCPIDYLQAVLLLIENSKKNLLTTGEKNSEIIEKKSLSDASSDVFYPVTSILKEMEELYQRKLGGDKESEQEEDIAKAYQSAEQESIDEAGGETIESTREKIIQCISYLEESYPHTPVIMLLKAADEWLGMSFDSIINSLMQKNATLEALYSMLTPLPPPPPMGMGGPGGGPPPMQPPNF